MFNSGWACYHFTAIYNDSHLEQAVSGQKYWETHHVAMHYTVNLVRWIYFIHNSHGVWLWSVTEGNDSQGYLPVLSFCEQMEVLTFPQSNLPVEIWLCGWKSIDNLSRRTNSITHTSP
jgi:hypothetical protein